MHFGSDNAVGACDAVLRALQDANAGPSAGYGADPWSERAADTLRELFEHDAEVFFVATGTAANTLALSCLVRPWQSVLCHAESHVANDESTGPEFVTGGARLVPIGAGAGKLTPAHLDAYFDTAGTLVPHNAHAAALSITQASELGQVYTPTELGALGEAARARDLRLHMDGARFANALAHLGCSPADASWRAGVDVLCLGATKGGALAAEAVIFFDRALADGFIHQRKRTGHLVSKSRLFGAQFCGWLNDGEWLRLAGHANAMAATLAEQLAALPGVRLVWPVQANELFVVLPKPLHERLQAAGAVYYEWPAAGLPAEQRLGDDEVLVRLVTSFATAASDIEALVAAVS